jgi:aspartate carbamoyltransferase catalytic subunit
MITEAQAMIDERMGPAELAAVMPPIDGDPTDKNFLSMRQLTADDIRMYIHEFRAAESLVQDFRPLDVVVLPGRDIRVLMRQESTRTGGTMMRAIHKLGGTGLLFSGMASSSEAKGESRADSELAIAAQADCVATRTAEKHGPAFTAHVIAEALQRGNLSRPVPVVNLGDGTNEHPTQTMGDLFTIFKAFDGFDGLTVTIVGDHERYRAHHSLMIAAAALGMNVMAVESSAAPVQPEYAAMLGDRLLVRTDDLDQVLGKTDILYMGRNPDEYDGEDRAEQARSEQLARDFSRWVMDRNRIQQMPSTSIVMHPRPRRGELHPSIDADHRMRDVVQMSNMIPARMAVLARLFGVSLVGL